jgi:hypothetical protein
MSVTATVDAAPLSDCAVDETVTQFTLALLRLEAGSRLDAREPMGRFQSAW